jgi:putative SOS response-associated peptidase YedK
MADWGLIPFWAKNAKMALSTINAEAESAAMAPAFREAFKRTAAAWRRPMPFMSGKRSMRRRSSRL